MELSLPICRNGVQPTSYHRSNTQTLPRNGLDKSGPVASHTSAGSTSARASLALPNSATNNRTRPPTTRPLQAYRGSQTTFHSSARLSTVPSSAPRQDKTSAQDFASTVIPAENGLLHDVSNKPSTVPTRSQVAPQRRTIVPRVNPNPSVVTSSNTDIPAEPAASTRSSSSISQGRKSGIPTVGKPQRPSTATVTR